MISPQDISQVVTVHRKSFSNFFLTSLGERFLRVYYNSVSRDPYALMLGYFEEGELLGFCAAAKLSGSFNKGLIVKNMFQFIRVGFILLFSRPAALLRLLLNFSKSDAKTKDTEEFAELLSIAVAENHQGEGVGKKLLIELEAMLRLEGIWCISLTTDYYNNDKAVSFYKSLGYRVHSDFKTYPRRRMYRMVKDLGTA